MTIRLNSMLQSYGISIYIIRKVSLNTFSHAQVNFYVYHKSWIFAPNEKFVQIHQTHTISGLPCRGELQGKGACRGKTD